MQIYEIMTAVMFNNVFTVQVLSTLPYQSMSMQQLMYEELMNIHELEIQVQKTGDV